MQFLLFYCILFALRKSVGFSRNLETYLDTMGHISSVTDLLILYYIDSTVAALTMDEAEFKIYIVQSISN